MEVQRSIHFNNIGSGIAIFCGISVMADQNMECFTQLGI